MKIFESFKNFKCIENQIYRLNLFKRWRNHNVFHVSFLKKFNVNRKKSAQTSQFSEFFYRIEKIELNENMKMKITNFFYEIETIKNNKIFKINKISNKLFNKLDFYYLIKWKNYENAIWIFVSFVKHFRKNLQQFHNENSNKFDVNKKTNYRKFKKKMKWNIYCMLI